MDNLRVSLRSKSGTRLLNCPSTTLVTTAMMELPGPWDFRIGGNGRIAFFHLEPHESFKFLHTVERLLTTAPEIDIRTVAGHEYRVACHSLNNFVYLCDRVFSVESIVVEGVRYVDVEKACEAVVDATVSSASIQVAAGLWTRPSTQHLPMPIELVKSIAAVVDLACDDIAESAYYLRRYAGSVPEVAAFLNRVTK